MINPQALVKAIMERQLTDDSAHEISDQDESQTLEVEENDEQLERRILMKTLERMKNDRKRS